MIYKTIITMLLAFAVLQVSQARMYCEYDIEYDGEDPDIVFTEFKQCTYREYETIRIEVESTECESSSSQYKEKQRLLKELNMARYQLDEFMCKLNKSILKRMKEAYLKFGCTTSSEYKSLVAEILKETESEVKQQLMEFRNGFTKCKSFIGSIIGDISDKFKSKTRGIFGRKDKSSSSLKFCDCDIEYSGQDPEIILNEIRKSTYKEYISVKRELELMKCEESSPKYQEKLSMLKELETSRFSLEEHLCDLSVSVLERMKAASIEQGSAVSSKSKSLFVEILSETEEKVRPHLDEFRKKHSRCRTFIGGCGGNGGSGSGGSSDCGSSGGKSDYGSSGGKSDCGGSGGKSDCGGSGGKSDCGSSGGKSDCGDKECSGGHKGSVIKRSMQVSKTRKFCDYDIEFCDEDFDIVLTEVTQCAFREYVNIKIELESTECDSSSSRNKEKQSLLKELEIARYRLEEYLNKKHKSILKRLEEAHQKFGSTTCTEYRSLIAEISSENESEINEHIMEFRASFTKCNSFVSSIMGKAKISNKFKGVSSITKGIFGGKSSSSTRKFCDYDIQYVGDNPEIILNEIRMSTYKDYVNVKKELQSMECEESSSKYEEKLSMLKELEKSRFHLEAHLVDLSVSVLERMKEAYLECGGVVSPSLKSLIDEVLGEAETQVRSHLDEFRKKHSRCRKFIGGRSGSGSRDCGGSGGKSDCGGSGRKSDCGDKDCSGGHGGTVVKRSMQVSKTHKFCDYDIEFCDEDFDIVLTEVTQCAYREYVNIKNELESAECDSSSSRYEEKQSLLKELEMARYRLEEYLNKKHKSILKRLEEAHQKFGSTTCSEYRSLIAEISSENESEINEHIMKFRASFTKCNSFVSSIMGKISNKFKGVSSITKGKFGGKSSSSTRKFCDYEIQYVGDNPEIILNEIRMSTYKEYISVKKELQSMECEESSSKYEEKLSMLKELEKSRFHLEAHLVDLNVSVLERMKAAYLECDGAESSTLKSLIVEVLSEAETKVRPHLDKFRKEHSRCRTFVSSGAVSATKGSAKGRMIGRALSAF